MKKAIMKKTKTYKFGLILKKGTKVFINEVSGKYLAQKSEKSNISFGVNEKDFEYINLENVLPLTEKEFRVTYRMEWYTKAISEEEALATFETTSFEEMVKDSSYVERVSIDEE